MSNLICYHKIDLDGQSSAAIAYLFLREALAPFQVLGGALVLGAIVLLQFRQERDELAPALIRARKFNGDKT